MFVRIAGYVVDNILDCFNGALACDQRYAIVGFLPQKHGVEAGSLQLSQREEFIDGLGFLNDDGVDASQLEPFDQMLKAYFDAVDVPGSDFHDGISSNNRVKKTRAVSTGHCPDSIIANNSSL